MLSAEAVQPNATCVPVGVVVRDVGAVGGVVSGVPTAAATRTIAATDGTPFVSTMKSMYGPGGAVFPLIGAVTFNDDPPAANVSGTKRWVMFSEWVSAPSGISDTVAIRAASGVATVKLVA